VPSDKFSQDCETIIEGKSKKVKGKRQAKNHFLSKCGLRPHFYLFPFALLLPLQILSAARVMRYDGSAEFKEFCMALWNLC
jgi:hypothetical protein